MQVENIPETIKNPLTRRAKESSREDFDMEEEVKEIVENQIDFYNKFKRNKKFREKFSEMMFEQYLAESS